MDQACLTLREGFTVSHIASPVASRPALPIIRSTRLFFKVFFLGAPLGSDPGLPPCCFGIRGVCVIRGTALWVFCGREPHRNRIERVTWKISPP